MALKAIKLAVSTNANHELVLNEATDKVKVIREAEVNESAGMGPGIYTLCVTGSRKKRDSCGGSDPRVSCLGTRSICYGDRSMLVMRVSTSFQSRILRKSMITNWNI